MAKLGFIGAGTMGGTLARAARRRVPGSQIVLSSRTEEKAVLLAQALDCGAATNAAVAEDSDFIFLGVKPQNMAGMLSEIAPVLAARSSRFVLVTMAAGLTIASIREMAGGDYPVIRIMPNAPSFIGKGLILYSCGDGVTAEDESVFLDVLADAGSLSPLPEHLIDAGCAVAGCGPAFVDLFIEALADGGVACGLPRRIALEYAAQMVLGSASLVLETGKHPGELKDAVCSASGATIQGVRALEQAGFRGAVMDAVAAAYEKSAGMG